MTIQIEGETELTVVSQSSGTDRLMKIARRSGDKSTVSRVRLFCSWLSETGQECHQPDLALWRDSLLAAGKAPTTVQAYLSSVRSTYRDILTDNEYRDILLAQCPQDASPADKKAYLDEVLTRLENAISPNKAKVKIVKQQDRPQGQHIRLSRSQANQLLAAPGSDSLKAIRDRAIIALLLCTGIREGELVSLDVDDLRQKTEDGELALYVRHGKGSKSRLVPYGDLDSVLLLVQAWLDRAGITSGAVFRGLRRGSKVGSDRLTTRSVQRILARYPVSIDGELKTVKPHDCRRTYACRCYDAGMDIVAIQQNLGHSSLETTLDYIGTLDSSKRRPSAIYSLDVSDL